MSGPAVQTYVRSGIEDNTTDGHSQTLPSANPVLIIKSPFKNAWYGTMVRPSRTLASASLNGQATELT